MKFLNIVFTIIILFPSVLFAGELKDMLNAEIPNESISAQSRNLHPSAKHGFGITQIGLERTSCLGSCPSYVVIIAADGKFKYVGEDNVKKKGANYGEVDQSKLFLLQEYITNIDFFKKDTYYALPVTDLPSSIIMVEKDGQKKYVLNYGNAAPAEIWALAELIDSIVTSAKWTTE